MRTPDFEKHQRKIALFSSAVYVLASGSASFLIKENIGIAALGYWSLCISIAGISSISDFGLNTAIIGKRSEIFSDKEKFQARVQTIFAFSILSYILIGLAVYFVSRVFLHDKYDYSNSIIVYIIISISVFFAARMFGSLLNIANRYWIFQVTLCGGSVVYILLVAAFSRQSGIVGVVVFHFMMNAIIFMVAGYFSIKVFRENFDVHFLRNIRIRPGLIYDLKSMALSVQLTFFLGYFADPLTRYTISSVSDISNVGYYDLAYRVLMLPKEVTARVFNGLSGEYAACTDDPAKTKETFDRNMKYLAFCAVAQLAITGALFGILQYFWSGEDLSFFNAVIYLLVFPTFVATIALSAWHWGIGNHVNRFNRQAIMISAIVTVVSALLSVHLSNVYIVLIGSSIGAILCQVYLLTTVRRLIGKRARETPGT